MTFNPDYPIFIGFNGPAGAGKTETAKRLVPRSSTSAYGDVNSISKDVWGNINPNGFPRIHWDHLWLSLPLYELYEVRTQITGVDADSRKLYQIHEIVDELLQKSIPYDDLIELVYDILHFPIDSTEEKPRSFLTGVGDLIRAADNLSFTNHMRRKIEKNWRVIQSEYEREDKIPPLYMVIVSDVRMPWEAEMIKTQPNNMLFKFEASEETLHNRLHERDGQVMTTKQKSHDTETAASLIPLEWFDMILDTDELTLEDQAKTVYNEIAQAIPTLEGAITNGN